MKFNISVFSIVFLILNAGCQSPRESLLATEWPQIVNSVRAKVLAESVPLDNASREIVLTKDPRLRVAHLPFGNDYRFVGTISSNHTVELWAYSDYRNLDRARVVVNRR